MALNDIGENLEGAGWLGAAVAAVILAPVMVRGLRPVTKRVIKGYLSMSDRMRGLMSETGERWRDLVAEAEAEHATRSARASAASVAATAETPSMEGGAASEPAMMPEPAMQQALERGRQLVMRQRALIHPGSTVTSPAS